MSGYPQGYPQAEGPRSSGGEEGLKSESPESTASQQARNLPPNLPYFPTSAVNGNQVAERLARIEATLQEHTELLRQVLDLPEVRQRHRRARARWEGGVKVGDPRVMARSFVRVQLLHGMKPWREVVAAGEEKGHSARTMRDERHHVAELVRVGGKCFWKLKNDQAEADRSNGDRRGATG